MKRNRPDENPGIESGLKAYGRLSKALVLQSLKKPYSLLPLGAAFLSGIPAGEAAIVYSGVQNIAGVLAGNTNRVYINIDLAGGNDFEIHRNHAFGNQFIQADEVAGGGFSLNAFHGAQVGSYAYPNANTINVPIGAGGPWANGIGQANTLSEINGAYPNEQWTGLAGGTTRFIGFRGTVAGQTRYGWMRITKNSFGNFTIVDWAYENTGASILTGQTVLLPIELVSFKAQQANLNTRLTWATASESNNAGFDIERSEDGTRFQSIGWIEGKGTTTEAQEYLFDDKYLREGMTYYYRLRQVDYNGQFDFSPVVTVTTDVKGTVVGEFYPNPATAGKVTLEVTSTTEGTWQAQVYDPSGKELSNQQIAVAKGYQAVAFDFSTLTPGLYFVKLQDGANKVYRRIVIE